jgi:hypothetical protein
MKQIVADTIGTLPEKERLVVSLYYYEDLNMKEIGGILGITESRVCQIHTKSVLRLRHPRAVARFGGAVLAGGWAPWLAAGLWGRRGTPEPPALCCARSGLYRRT